jgi:hypothetical protein
MAAQVRPPRADDDHFWFMLFSLLLETTTFQLQAKNSKQIHCFKFIITHLADRRKASAWDKQPAFSVMPVHGSDEFFVRTDITRRRDIRHGKQQQGQGMHRQRNRFRGRRSNYQFREILTVFQ